MLGALRFYFFLFCVVPSRHRDLSHCLYRNAVKEGLQWDGAQTEAVLIPPIPTLLCFSKYFAKGFSG